MALWKAYNFILTTFFIYQLVVYTSTFHKKEEQAYIFGSPLGLCTGGLNSQLDNILTARKPGLVIDVGSFDGKDAVRFARSGGHRVYTFEPVPSKAKRIQETIEMNGLGNLITFFPVALSNYSGTTDFYVSKHKLGKRNADVIVEGTEQDSLSIPWDSIHSNVISVKIGQLDDYIKLEEVLYLKVDAQGHDGEVLLGGKNAIEEKRIKFIQFEMSPGLSVNANVYVDVVKWLGKVGYSCFDCGFFKAAGMRGKSVDILKINSDNFVSLLQETTLIQRGVNVKKYTDILCTFL
ncbi:unnamed protein product [Bathycoccus prasinos]